MVKKTQAHLTLFVKLFFFQETSYPRSFPFGLALLTLSQRSQQESIPSFIEEGLNCQLFVCLFEMTSLVEDERSPL